MQNLTVNLTNREIRAVTFDADGTLWDFHAPAQYALEQLTQKVRQRYPSSARLLDIADFAHCWERAYKRLAPGGAFLSEIRRQSFFDVLEFIGESDREFAESLAEDFQRIRWSVLNEHVLQDARIAVRALREAGIVVGVLTNGSTRIEKINVGLEFDFTVYAEELGMQKPDRRVFDLAARKAGVGQGEMAHVGDTYNEDVFGAKAAGFVAIWLNMHSEPAPSDIYHDHEISALRELPRLVIPADRSPGL